MRKTVSIVVGILLVAATAFAASDLARTPSSLQYGGQAIQFFAPQTVTALTVNSTTVDLSSYIMFQVESGSGTTCYVRFMPASNSTMSSYPQTLFRTAGTRATFAVNPSAKFVNFSGCTAGSYLVQ